MKATATPLAPARRPIVEVEQHILGAALLFPDDAQAVLGDLGEDAFPTAQHRLIFRAIRDLLDDGLPVGVVEVTDRLRATGNLDAAGGLVYTTSLPHATFTTAQVSFYVAELRRVAAAHALKTLGDTLAVEAARENPPIEALLELASRMIETIRAEVPERAIAAAGVWHRQHRKGPQP